MSREEPLSATPASPVLWFLMQADGTLMGCQADDASRLHLPPAQFLGQRVHEVMPPALRGTIETALAQARDRGTSRFGYTLPSPLGLRSYEAELARLGEQGWIVAQVRDVTAQREGQAEHQRQNAFVALLMQLAGRFINLPLTEFDSAIDQALADTGQFVGADRSYLFHYDLAQGLATNTHEWCAEGIAPQIDKLGSLPLELVPEWLQAHLRGEAVYVPDVDTLPPGNLREILVPQGVRTTVALPLSGPAGCSGFVGFDFVRDVRRLSAQEIELLWLFAQMLVNVGERWRAQAELTELNTTLETRVQERTRQLAAAKEHAEAADRAKSELMARVSHELRTPLNAVLGFAQLLALDDALRTSPGAAGQVEQIRNAGAHLLSMIDDMLDLARAESGRLKLATGPVDLQALMAETVGMAAPLAQQHGVTLATPAPTGATPWVLADRTRLRQVLMNLLSNAVKYNHSGGTVWLEWLEGEGRHGLAVHDTGPGMTVLQLAGLFEPFNRAGAERSAVEGTGLGLAISRRLTALMGGELHVQSQPGQGSCFSVWLPRAEAPAPGAPQAASAARTPDGTATATAADMLRVLYVEDNAVNVLLMQAMLSRPECGPVQLEVCTESPLGVEAALAFGPDLILLDMAMPGLTGTELLQRLRAQPALASVPCVAVSANAMAGDIRAALSAGFDDYMTKPFTLEQVAALTARVRAGTRRRERLGPDRDPAAGTG